MTREIVLDTETTGFEPKEGHRIIEIGAVELINHLPSGKTLQLYINPERSVPQEATAVHGLTNEFLRDKPVFSQVFSKFIEFIGDDSILVIHNAEFDMKFINHELQSVGHPALPWNRVKDTLAMARQKFPGSPANLDALCRRFEIDNSGRDFHGALLDSQLLAEVYLELIGGRQHGLGLIKKETKAQIDLKDSSKKVERPYREPRLHGPRSDEFEAHKEMLQKLSDPIWAKISA